MFDKKELLRLIQELPSHIAIPNLTYKIGDKRFIDENEQSPENNLLRYCYDHQVKITRKEKEYDENGFFQILKVKAASEKFYISIPGYNLSYEGNVYLNDSASFVEPKEVTTVQYEPVNY